MFPRWGTHITRDMCFPGQGIHITRDMCLPGGGTHITRDMCFPGGGTHITRDMCFPGGATHISNDKQSDQKKFWNTIRPYISSRKKQSFHNKRIVLKDHGGVIREQKKDAKVLAEYFSSSQHPDFNQLPPKSYQTIKAHQSRSLTLTNTSPGEVKRIMKNLKTNKATGHDQIPARTVKESAEILCQPFSCLVNFLFER